MWLKTIFILSFIFIIATDFAFGQITSDTTNTKELYEDLESYSGKSKFTKLLHGMFFKPVAPGIKKRKLIRN